MADDRLRNVFELLLRPFDPKSDTPQDMGLGGKSTEYVMTEQAPDFGHWNVPQIWWTQGGTPFLMDPEQSNALASMYEAESGMIFPRYRNPGVASEMAMNRSAQGGATNNALAQYAGYRR